jgi:DNA helicase II / ATP-dependent DNA helicase PcrA
MKLMTILDDINAQQKEAITAGLGQILVLAGPGSGKTRVLTRRIAYLCQAMGVRPYNILAMTFTNKAAKEMRSRLEATLGSELDGIWLGTFHSACAKILRREANDYLPFNANFLITDADDQVTLVRNILKELNIDDKRNRPASIHHAISQAKNQLILAEDYPATDRREAMVARVYQRYQELLAENNAVDFDDLLLWVVRLFEDYPELRSQYARRFEHVLVDEFQDTNLAQYQLLMHLVSFHKNLFVVGDEDQSIYRWRGADYRNIQRFETDFPSTQKILLEQNYRSTQTVLNVAQAVIDQNTNRTRKNLTAARQEQGINIVLRETADDKAEAIFVVDTIFQWIAGGRAKGGDFAVMYRTNAQSRLLEEAFIRAGLPYRLVGAQRYYGRREVKDMIAFLRLAANPLDEISLGRVINTPPRGIGDKTKMTLQLLAEQAHIKPADLLLSLGRKGEQSPYWEHFNRRSVVPLADFGAMLANWIDAVHENGDLVALLDLILDETGYLAYLDDNKKDTLEGVDRAENIEELRRQAYDYQDRGLIAFLENVALVSDQDTIEDLEQATTLLTLHATKGLEFPIVIIIGLDEGLLPHSRSLDDPEEMAEERRLFYVGLTRAKERVYLARAERRNSYGSYEDNLPSRFLDDIPDDLLQTEGNRQYRFRSRQPTNTPTRWRTQPTFSPPPSAPRVKAEPAFRDGNRVSHPNWGEGIVLQSKIESDGEETVDVAFESVGIKRLLASLARLEILD